MAVVRSCVCLLVALVYLQVVMSKPFLDGLLCDMICTDDDITATTVSTTPTDALDDLFSFDCSFCPTTATTPRPAQSIAVRLPAVPNGLNMNVTDNNGVLQFLLDAAPNTGAPQATAPPPAPGLPDPSVLPGPRGFGPPIPAAG